MNINNGWYSVFDAENRPESGEEVLCLGMLDGSVEEAGGGDPLADPDNRIYYIAEWFFAGDIMMDETASPDPSLPEQERILENIFWRETRAPLDGFYIKEAELAHRDDTSGGRLPTHTIIYRHERLCLHGEGADGLIAWKPLDWPTEP